MKAETARDCVGPAKRAITVEDAALAIGTAGRFIDAIAQLSPPGVTPLTRAGRLWRWAAFSTSTGTCHVAHGSSGFGELTNWVMVGVRGFEPPAPASRKQCSTRLSYTPPTGRNI